MSANFSRSDHSFWRQKFNDFSTTFNNHCNLILQNFLHWRRNRNIRQTHE